MSSLRSWFKSGTPWIWLNASAVSVSLIMVFGLLSLIAVRGMSYFWPADILEIDYRENDGSEARLIGEIWDAEKVAAARLKDGGYPVPEGREFIQRYLLKQGNREILGADFRLVLQTSVLDRRKPENLIAVERREWGNLYGYLRSVKEDGRVVAAGDGALAELERRLERARRLHDQTRDIEKHEIGDINYGLERLRLRERRLELEGKLNAQSQAEIGQQRRLFQEQYQGLQARLGDLNAAIRRDGFSAEVATGGVADIALANVVRVYQPNRMSVFGKSLFYIEKLWEFVSDAPREANTEGGVFPAIFGTVMMVLIMAVLVTPFGVIAAVYLREYARQGPLTRTIRIAVNNLAGVPSIVYGVFGLGFFVYFLGGSIDELFFPEALPAPTFGSPGILWSSLTLAILTLPVVIVATEEGLARIPSAIRQGSLALGATKFETLRHIVIPMASPAIMTGLILAVARAAGEVAPLMLVGVVKLAPSLPLDGNFPFLHLERKFMHLGFHIYDVGFQSPNVEAARPLVYATALLLVAVIVVLNLTAIAIRNRLREKYRTLES